MTKDVFLNIVKKIFLMEMIDYLNLPKELEDVLVNLMGSKTALAHLNEFDVLELAQKLSCRESFNTEGMYCAYIAPAFDIREAKSMVGACVCSGLVSGDTVEFDKEMRTVKKVYLAPLSDQAIPGKEDEYLAQFKKQTIKNCPLQYLFSFVGHLVVLSRDPERFPLIERFGVKITAGVSKQFKPGYLKNEDGLIVIDFNLDRHGVATGIKTKRLPLHYKNRGMYIVCEDVPA